MILAVTIPARELSTAHRAAQFTQRGRRYSRAEPAYVAWLNVVREHVTKARPGDWDATSRYLVRIVLWEPTAHARDVDNLAKGCLDSANGERVKCFVKRGGKRKAGRTRLIAAPHTLWLDDSQIDVLEVVRAGVDRERPRVCMLVRSLDAGEAERMGRMAELVHA